MIDLKPILVDLRQYLLNELDGFPTALAESKDKASFVSKLQAIASGAPIVNYNDDPELLFLTRYINSKQNHQTTLFFSRLLILKFLYDETVKDKSLIQDKSWFTKMRGALNTEFEQHKNGLESIKIDGREIHSLNDLAEIRRQAQQDMLGPDRFRPVLYAVMVIAIFRKILQLQDLVSDHLDLAISFIMIATGIYGNRLLGTALRARNTFFHARDAEANFRQQPDGNIMNNENIKKFFLLSDDELNAFNKGPELN